MATGPTQGEWSLVHLHSTLACGLNSYEIREMQQVLVAGYTVIGWMGVAIMLIAVVAMFATM
ncbi:hypothetical protein ACFQAT_03625 [Undibacterium arcticum]|uniref:Uncharacterized protein n=1 Tax=Undibacterium arcticum TaxID=1762892 RepID=A0ABV7F364_9BURK